MKRVLSYLRWVVLTLGVLFLILVVGVVLFARTERFRALLRDQLVNTLNTSIRGDVNLGRIEGSIWNTLTLHDLAVTYQGTEVLRAPRLTISYALLSLLEGRVRVIRAEGWRPIVRLKQDERGNWNLVEAFSPDAAEPQEPSRKEGGLDILLETVIVQDAQVDVTPAGQDARTYHLTGANLDARLGIVAAGLEIQVRQLASQLMAPGFPQAQLAVSFVYQGATAPSTVQISNLTLDTTQSRLRVTGEISDLSAMDTKIQLVLENLATADAVQLVPDWPLKQDLSGALQVSGPLADLRARLALAATDAQVTAEVRADLSQDAPRYRSTITFTRFDARKMLQREDMAGLVEGTVQASGVGTLLADVQGEARVQVHALQVANWQVGNVSVNGSVDQQRAKVSGELRGAVGQAMWQGTFDLTQKQPCYELALAVEHLDVKKVAMGEEPVTSDLNLTGTIKGQGLALAEMEAQSEVHLRPSTVGPVAVERGRLGVRIADGRIHISELTLNATDTTVAVRGEINTTGKQTGDLTYVLQVGDVAPWLSLVDQQGSGALSLTGETKGSLADLRVQGKLTANKLQVAETAIQNGVVTFALDGVGQSQPRGVIAATLQGIRSGLALQTAAATVTLPPSRGESAPLSAQVEVKVQDIAARTHQLQGEVSYQPERLTARLTQLSLESPDGTWRLSQPASIVQEKSGIAVERLLMVLRDQRILVDGRVALAGEQNLRVQIDRFALATLQPWLPQKPEMKGMLSMQTQIDGTAVAPRIESTVNLAALRIAGQDYAGLSASLGYAKQQASLALTFQQDATHTLNAAGSLPLSVSWAAGGQAQVLGNLDLQVSSAGVNLAFLNAFTGQAVQGVAGKLSLDIALQGPVTGPLPRGTFQLREGKATIDPLGVEIAAVAVQGQVDPGQVRIDLLSARAKEGQLTGSGAIVLRDYLPQHLTLSLSADHWPVIQTHQYQITIDGRLTGEGPLTAPRITGQLSVPEATVRPELEFLDTAPVKRDETIVVLSAKAPAERPAPSTSPAAEAPHPPQGGVFENLALDLTVLLPRNIWVKQRNAEVELAGDLYVTKQQGRAVVLVGTIETVRGWLGFQGRRFTLTEGQVVFAGESEINPQLHIVTQHRLPEYRVETVVGGTMKKPSLTLRSDPVLEQADILALLLFGKRASALGSGEKVNLQQQALQLTSGYAAAKIGESVSRALGLEELGIDLREVDFSGGRLGFGRYLSPDTYVSMSQDIGGKKGREVSVEYNFSPDWKLTTSTSATGGSTAGITWQKQY